MSRRSANATKLTPALSFPLGTDGVTVSDSATTVLGAIGADNNDNAMATTLVAANEDGSVFERLEQLQEAVNRGAGTSVAAGKSLVDAIGSDGTTLTDSATSVVGILGVNDADNAFSSASVVANEDGSILERLEHLRSLAVIAGGTAQAGAAGTITLAAGASAVNDFYNGQLVIITGGTGAGQVRAILDYVGATKVATIEPDWATTPDNTSTYSLLPSSELKNAIGANNADNDFDSSNVAANEDGSVLERLEQLQEAVNKGAGTALAAGKSLVDALGSDGNALIDGATSVVGVLGVNDADNLFDSSAVAANVDGSVLERLEDLKDRVNAVDDLVDTEVAAIQTDIGDPSARANFSSLETMLGLPDAVNSCLDDMLRTGFDSTAVGSNADGSIMEREEWLQVQVGTLVNTAGTATLGAMIGDLANDSLVARLNDIGSDVNGATTDTIQGKIGTDTELADRSLFDILAGDGPAVFPNAAVPANDVSLAEVLRSVWAGLMGTAAGENGLAAFPAAAAPANDVSLAEVIRAIYDRQLGDGTDASTNTRLGKRVQRAAADIFTGGTVALFTVTGRVLVTQISIVTSVAAMSAGASNTNIRTNPTVGTDANMCANLDIDGDEIGTVYSITGNPADAMAGGSGGGAMGMDRGFIVPAGTIDIVSAADSGLGGALGAVDLWYLPLTDGASVVTA